MPDLVFKNVTFQYEPRKRLPAQSRQLEQMFTVNNKDTRATPLKSLILNIINIDILNIEQLSHLILVLNLLTLNR